MPSTSRLPTYFISHGGGPWPWLKNEMGDTYAQLAAALADMPRQIGRRPKAVLMVSAHWEAPAFTLQTHPQPPMLYDYGGFPPESYEIKWDAPGDPLLASRVRALLSEADIQSAENSQRGFDHGTFVPLKLADPSASIPTVQLSLKRGLDPQFHLQLGQALSPLRDEGVLIIGSGSSFHNMRAFAAANALAASQEFDNWLVEILSLPHQEREEQLVKWSQAPQARFCHPREEHLLPLHVIAGTALPSEKASFPFRQLVLGTQMLAAEFS